MFFFNLIFIHVLYLTTMFLIHVSHSKVVANSTCNWKLCSFFKFYPYITHYITLLNYFSWSFPVIYLLRYISNQLYIKTDWCIFLVWHTISRRGAGLGPCNSYYNQPPCHLTLVWTFLLYGGLNHRVFLVLLFFFLPCSPFVSHRSWCLWSHLIIACWSTVVALCWTDASSQG